jgi:hypothetical protein
MSISQWFDDMQQERDGRLQREQKTVSTMILMHCEGKHGQAGGDLCDDCARLHGYAMERVGTCRYGDEKPTCRKCPVHCYKPEMREKIRVVMRYAGPRMLFKHPRLAFQHLLDGTKAVRKKLSQPGI